MPDPALLLGPVVFQDFEIPSGVNFGGRQRLALHRLPGGVRVIDTMGRDDAQIAFSGIFSGSDATLRARGLDELRASGFALPLAWDVFFYTVVISDFYADYRNNWWIPYCVTCTVLRDEASALVQPLVSLTTSVLADIGNAASDALNVGYDLLPLQMALGTPGATVRGTASYSAAQSSLTATRTSLDAEISSANATLTRADPRNANSADICAARLLQTTDAAEQLSWLTSARSYVARAAVNLENASS